ncbi:hypothetical protein D3C81_1610600 [compost metagenome]
MREAVRDQFLIIQFLVQRRTAPEQKVQHQLGRQITAHSSFPGHAFHLFLEAEQQLRHGHRQLALLDFCGYLNRFFLKDALDLTLLAVRFTVLVAADQLEHLFRINTAHYKQ